MSCADTSVVKRKKNLSMARFSPQNRGCAVFGGRKRPALLPSLVSTKRASETVSANPLCAVCHQDQERTDRVKTDNSPEISAASGSGDNRGRAVVVLCGYFPPPAKRPWNHRGLTVGLP